MFSYDCKANECLEILAYEQMLIQEQKWWDMENNHSDLLYYLPVIRPSGLEFTEFLSRFLGVINGK